MHELPSLPRVCQVQTGQCFLQELPSWLRLCQTQSLPQHAAALDAMHLHYSERQGLISTGQGCAVAPQCNAAEAPTGEYHWAAGKVLTMKPHQPLHTPGLLEGHDLVTRC